MQTVIIATLKEWNIKNYFLLKENYGSLYSFHLITTKEELSASSIASLNPDFIFFPHWSWKIDASIYANYKCVIFHETDLPYGRGGSPLQNLIIQEQYETKISAIVCSEKLDAGDIYLQKNIDISSGSMQEIFTAISKIIFTEMIPKLLQKKIIPKKQKGPANYFKRRTPEQSDILTLQHLSMHKLYDYIRMVDAEGYPKIYMKMDTIKIEFSKVKKIDNRLIGQFEVTENE